MKKTGQRDKDLEIMGFASYRAYLDSTLWQTIRRKRLDATPLCAKCGDTADTVHHADYRLTTLKGHNPLSLICLCRACHTRAHSPDAKGRPRYNSKQATDWILYGGAKSARQYHRANRKRKRRKRRRASSSRLRKDTDPRQRDRDEARLADIKRRHNSLP